MVHARLAIAIVFGLAALGVACSSAPTEEEPRTAESAVGVQRGPASSDGTRTDQGGTAQGPSTGGSTTAGDGTGTGSSGDSNGFHNGCGCKTGCCIYRNGEPYCDTSDPDCVN